MEPSNDPSNDILIVSINGSQIELEYSQFGGEHFTDNNEN